MIHIGFLLNQDAAHQVMHSVPIAYELLRNRPEISVSIFCTTAAEVSAVERIAGDYPDIRCRVEMVEPPGYATAFDRLTGHALLAKRFGVLWSHRERFRKLDMLVVPDKTSLVLKRWLGGDCPVIVNTFHGAGDRAGGFKGVRRFDYHLVPGRKYEARMLAEGMVDRDRYEVIGYVKFDRLGSTPRPELFTNGRPTVLYAPHFDPKFSSWYGWGTAILDYFINNKEFNLIFAPHVLMYKRMWHISTEGGLPRLTPPVPDSVRQVDNIIVDKGSVASIDMTYTRAADIFLGDVSSLVYEFLVEPRPCIFLNCGGSDWMNNENFRFWDTGEVIDTVNDLQAALARTQTAPDRYRAQQERARSEAFDLTETLSSVRAARAICNFLAAEGLLPAT